MCTFSRLTKDLLTSIPNHHDIIEKGGELIFSSIVMAFQKAGVISDPEHLLMLMIARRVPTGAEVRGHCLETNRSLSALRRSQAARNQEWACNKVWPDFTEWDQNGRQSLDEPSSWWLTENWSPWVRRSESEIEPKWTGVFLQETVHGRNTSELELCCWFDLLRQRADPGMIFCLPQKSYFGILGRDNENDVQGKDTSIKWDNLCENPPLAAGKQALRKNHPSLR